VAQECYEINACFHGKEIEWNSSGKDFVKRTRNVRTGRVMKTTHVEIRSSDTALISKRQKEMKRPYTNYKVKIIKPVMY